MRCTARGLQQTNEENASVPTSEKLSDGQYADHWVLCEAERAKGFVRPVRQSYQHLGIAGPKFETQPLTDEQERIFGGNGYVAFEVYPDGYKDRTTGRFWKQQDLDKVGKGCGTVTRMGLSIAETYARNPHYYGSTFCCGCNDYLPVGADGEFVWDGTNERVGT